MSLLKNKVAIRKRVIVTLLLLVLFVIPIVAVKSNVNADTFGVFKYSVSNDGNIVIVGLSDTSVTTIDIPSEIDGKPVTMIEKGAFQYCKNIKRVNIADSVEKIGDYAFVGCTGITGTLAIPNSVREIGYYGFYGCTGITGTLVIPDSVETIGYSAFEGCTGVTELKIGNSVKRISSSTFKGCTGITGTLVIPDSVEEIGENAFKGCTSITELKIGNSVKKINSSTFEGCTGITGTLVIPDSVEEIGGSAFKGCTDITEITISDSVQTIGNQAFSGLYSLKTLNLGNGVKCIGQNAFEGAKALKELNIPESVENINSNAFLNCTSLSIINLPDNNINFGKNVFSNTAWFNSQDAGVVYLGKKLYCYRGAMPSNTTISIIDGTNQICAYAFDGFKNLISISIPNSIKCIDDYAFNGCTNLKNITLCEGITTIGKYAFSNCYGLTNLETPSTINKISDRAFYNCRGLTNVKILGGSLENSVFNNCNNITDLTILSGEVPSFYGCKKLVNVTLGNKVTYIGNRAFAGCTGLTNIIIPDSVTTIGQAAFSGCLGLTQVEIPDSVKNINKSAFSGCSSIEKITIGKGVEYIGDYAFYGLTKFNPDIIIPENVKSVGAYAYANCKSVTSLIINANAVSFGEKCFYNCENLEKLVVNGSVGSVGTNLFDNTKIYDASEMGYYYKNKKVKTGIIKEGAESIPYNAFLGCENLKTLYIESSVLSSLKKQSDEIIFYGCNNLEKVAITEDNPNFTVVDDIIYSKDMTRLIRCLPGKKGKVNIPSSVTKIESYAFYGCKYLEGELVIPDSVTVLESKAFSDCLSEIPLKIGNGIEEIKSSTFENSKFTGQLIIPNNVKNIGRRAFFNCYNFTGELTLNENIWRIESQAFEGCSSISGTLKFLNESVRLEWSAFALCEGIEKIEFENIICGSKAFAHCINLKSIVGKNISSSNSYEDAIFIGCYSLKNIDSLIGTDREAADIAANNYYSSYFLECEGIERVGTNFKCLSSDMFRSAKSLKEVEIASGITKIPRGIFAKCPNLKTVKIPSSVKTIHSLAFYKTTNIQDIYVDNNRSDVNYAEYLEGVCPNVHYLDSVYTVNKNVPDNIEIIDIEKPELGEFKYNSNYKFKIAVKDGYEMSNLIVKTVIRGEEKELQPKVINGENVYVLENIKDNIDINVTAEIDLLSLNENNENS